jgi:hypothetical protein
MSLFSTRIINIYFFPPSFHGYKNKTELFTLQREITEQVWLLGAYTYYSTKEMGKKKTCLLGYENFLVLGETNNQFSMAWPFTADDCWIEVTSCTGLTNKIEKKYIVWCKITVHVSFSQFWCLLNKKPLPLPIWKAKNDYWSWIFGCTLTIEALILNSLDYRSD